MLPEIATACENGNDFLRKILVLYNLIDWMDIQTMRSTLTAEFQDKRSVVVLEEYLNQKFGTFNPIIIRNLRDIIKLRDNMFPVHKEGEEVIKIFNKLGSKYPPDDWDFVWEKVVALYIDSIKGLINLLN